MKKHGITFFCIAVLIAADQASKGWAVSALKGQDAFAIIKNVFELQYLENHGAAFGILQNRQGIFFMITLLALMLLTYVYFRMPKSGRYRPMKGCYILLIAGAMGNFIDRLRQGYVVDFFYFRWIDFPIFNLADVYVVIAIGVLLVLILFYYREDELDFLGRKG